MHELDELRGLAALVRQPSFDAIESTARRRRRRAMAAGTAVGAAVALVAAGGALLTGTYESSAPPAPEPVSGRMTPEEVVTGEASRLVAGAASVDDPDVRIALWEADCEGCGVPDGTWSTTSALALTTDGFDSATYVTAPPLDLQEHPVVGEPRGVRIESPAEELFLVVGTEAPGEWLVTSDGHVRRVERVATRLAPTDPRLWFRCRPADPPSAWKGAPFIDPAQMYPWCALDPDSATAYEWPARWNGSLSLPVSGDAPWGVDSLWQPTFAWWEVDGQRHRRFLAESPPDVRGAVWNPPTGAPLFFTRFDYESSLNLLAPREGPGLRVVSLDAPGGASAEQFFELTGTPEGALLAVQTYPPVIWRLEDLANDDFELVHQSEETTYRDPAQMGWMHEPTVAGDRIHVMTQLGTFISDDDGRTWTEITTWR